MLRTFRQIAALFMSWYIYGVAAGIMAGGMQPLFDSLGGAPEVAHHALLLPTAIAAFLAGLIAAAAVKPRGDRSWGWVFAAMVLLSDVWVLLLTASEPVGVNSFGAVLGAALHVAAALAAFAFVRRYEFAGSPTPRSS